MRVVARVSAVALCAALAACSDSSVVASTPPSSADLVGDWSLNEAVRTPGNRYGWTLAVTGTQVTGTGIFAGEAGPFGTMTINGTILPNDSLHLAVHVQYNVLFSIPSYDSQFDGILFSHTAIVGRLTRTGSPPDSLHLSKVP